MTLVSFARALGAICYGLWGLLHLLAAADVFRIGSEHSEGLVQARLFQGGWNLLVIAILAVAVSLSMNLRNSWKGYWLNLFLIGASDIGYLMLLVMPGHSRNIAGPALWLIGLALSTLAILKSPRTP